MRFFVNVVPVLGVLAATVSARPAFAADPTTADCLTANESSIALKRDHKLRAAREQLLVCSAASCPSDIQHECIRRVGEVNAEMPTVTFEAKDGAGNDLTDVKVTMDGQVVAQRLQGVSLSIDPGKHEFTFEAPGQTTMQKTLVVVEGQKERHERIDFPLPASATVPPAGVVPPIQDPVAPAPRGQGQRTGGLIVAGGGVAVLGVAGILGLVAKSKDDSAAGEGFPAKHDDSVSASRLADAATVVAGVGAAALAVGGVLWLTAPRSQTTVGTSGNGIWVRGSF